MEDQVKQFSVSYSLVPYSLGLSKFLWNQILCGTGTVLLELSDV